MSDSKLAEQYVAVPKAKSQGCAGCAGNVSFGLCARLPPCIGTDQDGKRFNVIFKGRD